VVVVGLGTVVVAVTVGAVEVVVGGLVELVVDEEVPDTACEGDLVTWLSTTARPTANTTTTVTMIPTWPSRRPGEVISGGGKGEGSLSPTPDVEGADGSVPSASEDSVDISFAL
jgi:hypothetical protein